MIEEHIDQTYNFIQNVAEVTGCYDVFPRKEMQYVIREAALASHSSR